jgi:hypothetical protein
MKKLETKSTVLLKHHLKMLKLPTMLSECEKVAATCGKDNVDHLGYLLQLCELELIDRERRAKERRIKAARFATIKTLENFEFKAQPSVNKVLVTELMRCEYIDKRENVLLLGNPGTGKTHLATALAFEACCRGKRVAFWRVTELITSLLEAREEKSLLRLRKQLSRLDDAAGCRTGATPGKPFVELGDRKHREQGEFTTVAGNLHFSIDGTQVVCCACWCVRDLASGYTLLALPCHGRGLGHRAERPAEPV